MRAIFTAAAQHLLATQTKMGLWQDVNGWLIPKLSPLEDGQASAERVLEFRLAGTFLALHLLVLRYPVARISPHILLYLLCGSCPPNHEYLRNVDPNAASILAPWFEFLKTHHSSTSLDRSMGAGVRHLLAEYLGESVRYRSSAQRYSFDGSNTGQRRRKRRYLHVGAIYPSYMEYLLAHSTLNQVTFRMAGSGIRLQIEWGST
jgi:hypothetical protein